MPGQGRVRGPRSEVLRLGGELQGPISAKTALDARKGNYSPLFQRIGLKSRSKR